MLKGHRASDLCEQVIFSRRPVAIFPGTRARRGFQFTPPGFSSGFLILQRVFALGVWMLGLMHLQQKHPCQRLPAEHAFLDIGRGVRQPAGAER